MLDNNTLDLGAIGDLPRLPSDWRWQGRQLVYEGENYEAWAKLLTYAGELAEKSQAQA